MDDSPMAFLADSLAEADDLPPTQIQLLASYALLELAFQDLMNHFQTISF